MRARRERVSNLGKNLFEDFAQNSIHRKYQRTSRNKIRKSLSLRYVQTIAHNFSQLKLLHPERQSISTYKATSQRMTDHLRT